VLPRLMLRRKKPNPNELRSIEGRTILAEGQRKYRSLVIPVFVSMKDR
jgi:hypothetical protein